MSSTETKKSVIRIIVVALVLIVIVIAAAGLIVFFTSRSGSDPSAPVSAPTNNEAGVSEGDELIIPAGLPEIDNLPYSISVAMGNSWDDNGKTSTQLDITVTNHSDAPLSDWRYSFDVPAGTEIKQSWNGTFSIDGTVLTITPGENSEIPAGSSVSMGVIISSSTPMSTEVTQNPTQADTQTEQTSSVAPADTVKTVIPEAEISRNEGAVQGDDWLFVKGNKIVDKDGKEVWLTGCNWFGYNTGTNIFDGIWNSNLENSVSSIADHGFNVIRMPFSVELINQWSAGTYPKANYNQALNPNLNGKNSLEIFDYVVELCEANGIKIIIDIHSAKTDAMGHMTSLWYTGDSSTEQYYKALEWMAGRYKNNDTIIAYDIKNEPHGKPSEGLSNMAIWNNSTSQNNWKYVAETAAQRVLAKNPNVLILVEGTEAYPTNISSNNFTSTNNGDYHITWWGGNLRGVKDYPINLGKYQNKLMYSPHDYGPTVYKQPWFNKNYTFDTLMADCWHDNWFYIYENKTAPLLIGEWGGFMTEPNLTWMTHMRKLIKDNRLHHTFWCYNANSGDTGGLVKDDFTTWDTEKYNFVKEVLWQENGKFVGLDHEIPLGENGISVSDVK